MNEINFLERLKPAQIFLKTLGYNIVLPNILNKWVTMDIVNKEQEKIGNAYLGKTYIEMLGEDKNLKFEAKYKLKNYQNEDKIIANLSHDFYNTTYRLQVILSIKSPLIGKDVINVIMQVFSNNHQEFLGEISNNESIILDSFDVIRGKEHMEVSHNDKQFTIKHQKENNTTKEENIVLNAPDDKIYTIKKMTYANGEDLSKRYYPLTKSDNLISTLSSYLYAIDPIFKISLGELNDISREMFKNLISLCFPEFKEKDLANLLGINKKNAELSRILEK